MAKKKDITKMTDQEIIDFLMKNSPESLGYKATDKRAKGGMMKKKGYAKGGAMKKKGYAKGGAMKKKGYAKGGAMKKKGYAMGGMMEERKVNPTTGMMMKKGGMVDMRKSGMFSKGGLTKKRPRGK
tara:strand:+ start:489 stop:866 length:378 start_codon:yes stop_codon:yes gene_type:complete